MSPAMLVTQTLPLPSELTVTAYWPLGKSFQSSFSGSHGTLAITPYTALSLLLQDRLAPDKDSEILYPKFIDRIQELYFNKTFCYRGDFLNFSYKELTDQLNIKFAVSNYQENLARRYFKLEKIKKSIKYFAKYLPFYKSY